MDHVLSTDYTLGFASEVAPPDRRNVYDLQDEFYLPLAGFHRVERPGPNLKVYVRRGKEPDNHGPAVVKSPRRQMPSVTPGHHAADFAVYAHLQLAQDRAAARLIDKALKTPDRGDRPAALVNYTGQAAMPAR